MRHFSDGIGVVQRQDSQRGQYGGPGRSRGSNLQGETNAGKRPGICVRDRREAPRDLWPAQGADPDMKALLMHRDRDFELQQELPANERELMHDLEIGTLLRAM